MARDTLDSICHKSANKQRSSTHIAMRERAMMRNAQFLIAKVFCAHSIHAREYRQGVRENKKSRWLPPA
jgi:hypothetical protein